ncbi:MAG TPA: SagB/ThcOx family dehydrogenase [Polyangiaceae bacterium]|nr:SagB/ThcOx family dehydrogenase [Polyangiaceae bacterium]
MQPIGSLERAVGVVLLVGASGAFANDAPAGASAAFSGVDIKLPAPRRSGAISLEEAIARRRSTREFSSRMPADDQLGQLLWAAQGVTDTTHGLRAAPSAGALYPLELYLARADGVYHYEPGAHGLRRVDTHDERAAMGRAAFGQSAVLQAPILLAVVGIVSRTRAKYGGRAERYVTLEAGHAAQNILLEATALGLAAVPVGAFDDDGLRSALGLASDATPLYVLPVGFGVP